MKGASKIAILTLIFFASIELSAQGMEKIDFPAEIMQVKTLGAWKNLIAEKEKTASYFSYSFLSFSGGRKDLHYPSWPAPREAHSFFCDIEDFISRKLRMPIDLGPE
jgi:hypothetical protein